MDDRRLSSIHIRSFMAVCALCSIVITGCATEFVQSGNRPTDAHDAYLQSLEKAGLGNTVLVRKWKNVSESALESPLEISTPYQETGFFDPIEPDAVGYVFEVVRGRRITVEFMTQDPEAPGIYADLFRIEEDRQEKAGIPVHVASRNSVLNKIEFEPKKDGRYLFRLQPELLKGGRYSITILNEPALKFPIQGNSMKSIIGLFGDQRDGGRRQHEGIDIKADRGTPVLSPSRAFVSSVGTSELGGNVVWLLDEDRSLRLYFAHLETQTVSTGTWVNTGDMIGTVGNTGNASASPYHLHFGVYLPGAGPADPRAFIQPGPGLAPVQVKYSALLGSWLRVKKGIPKKTDIAGAESGFLLPVPAGVPVRMKGESGSFARIALPDGRGGYVRLDTLEVIDRPLEKRIIDRAAVLRTAPLPDAGENGTVPAGGELLVLGIFDGHFFVRTPDGINAWIGPAAL